MTSDIYKTGLLSQPRFQPPKDWDWGFKTVDGIKIRYGQARSRKVYDAVVTIIGGLGDFGEQYFEIANELDARNIKSIIIDLPGQGGSGRYLPNQPMKRHSAGFDKLLADIHTVIDEIVLSSAIDIEDNHKRLPIILLAHSMGGHIALRYLAEYNKSSRGDTIFSCAALTAPMTGIRAVDSFPKPIGMALVHLLALRPKSYVPGGCDWYNGYRERAGLKGIFSSDPERYQLQRTYFTHPDYKYLATGSPTCKWLLDAALSCKKIREKGYLEHIQIPILMAVAGNDMLVSNMARKETTNRLKNCEYLEIKGARHEILMESDMFRKPFVERFFTFIEENVLNKTDKGKTFIQ